MNVLLQSLDQSKPVWLRKYFVLLTRQEWISSLSPGRAIPTLHKAELQYRFAEHVILIRYARESGVIYYGNVIYFKGLKVKKKVRYKKAYLLLGYNRNFLFLLRINTTNYPFNFRQLSIGTGIAEDFVIAD